jgi:mRNA interferase MazF
LGSVTFCGLTTDLAEAPGLWRPLVEATPANGLQSNSAIMVDKIMTMPRSRFGRRIGSLEQRDVTVLERSLLFFLGLQS